MTYKEKVNKIHAEAVNELSEILEKHSEIILFDFEKEDWEESEYFHDLPQQIVFTDPMYDNYYLHKVYLEDNTINIQGFAPELEEYYDFTIEEIFKGEFLYLIDKVIETIDLENRKEEKLLEELLEQDNTLVTCGMCGKILLHNLPDEEITCPHCGFNGEPCDFPDYQF